MKAWEARRLRIGERVEVYMGTSLHIAEVVSVHIPHVTIRAVLASGQTVEEPRRYNRMARPGTWSSGQTKADSTQAIPKPNAPRERCAVAHTLDGVVGSYEVKK